MSKITTTILLALLLTACGTQESDEVKKFNTEKKEVEEKKAIDSEMKRLEEKIASLEKTDTTTPATKDEKHTESYAKNIFELTTIEGEKLHVDEAKNGILFQEHRDKVIFLLFFGYRCPPCLSEIPALIQLAKEKGDKLEIIALEVQRLPEEQLKIFKESKKLNYTVLSGEHTQNDKFISYIAQRAQWSGAIPFLVGIKPSGEVGLVHVGGMSAGEFKMVFDQLSQ